MKTTLSRDHAMEQYYTVKEIAEMLKVTMKTIYRIIEAGELPAARVGKSLRISETNLKKYLDKQTGADNEQLSIDAE